MKSYLSSQEFQLWVGIFRELIYIGQQFVSSLFCFPQTEIRMYLFRAPFLSTPAQAVQEQWDGLGCPLQICVMNASYGVLLGAPIPCGCARLPRELKVPSVG